jgi:hypothetical protein
MESDHVSRVRRADLLVDAASIISRVANPVALASEGNAVRAGSILSRSAVVVGGVTVVYRDRLGGMVRGM